MSKNKYINLQLKYCTLLPTFICLNTWSLFLDISLCALHISRPSQNNTLKYCFSDPNICLLNVTLPPASTSFYQQTEHITDTELAVKRTLLIDHYLRACLCACVSVYLCKYFHFSQTATTSILNGTLPGDVCVTWWMVISTNRTYKMAKSSSFHSYQKHDHEPLPGIGSSHHQTQSNHAGDIQSLHKSHYHLPS